MISAGNIPGSIRSFQHDNHLFQELRQRGSHLAYPKVKCVLLRVPQSLIFRLSGRQVHVRHVCPTMAQQVRHIQFCAVF